MTVNSICIERFFKVIKDPKLQAMKNLNNYNKEMRVRTSFNLQGLAKIDEEDICYDVGLDYWLKWYMYDCVIL